MNTNYTRNICLWESWLKAEEKGTTEAKMVGWHHWLNGHEFEKTQGDSGGHGVAESRTWLSNWTTEIRKHRVDFRYSSIQSFSSVTRRYLLALFPLGSVLTHVVQEHSGSFHHWFRLVEVNQCFLQIQISRSWVSLPISKPITEAHRDGLYRLV